MGARTGICRRVVRRSWVLVWERHTARILRRGGPPAPRPALAVFAFTAFAAFAALSSSAAGAGPPHIRLRGRAHVEVHVAREVGRDFGKVSLSGSVVDDAGRPVVGARVAISFTRNASVPDSAPPHPLLVVPPVARGAGVPLGPTFPEPCDPANAEPEILRDGSGQRVLVAADERAHFCATFDLPTDRYTAHVEAQPTSLVDGAATDLPFDLTLPPVTLRFAPERSTLSLDDDATFVSVVAAVDPASGAALAAGLPLALSNESGVSFGTATTDASGLARFVVDGARLGPPGPGELRVTFPGSARVGSASQAMRVERRARVVMEAPDATAGRLPPGSPEDGIPLKVSASLACARRGCSGLPGGVVEASMPSEGVVGAAPLVGGSARLLISFANPSFDGAAESSSGPGPAPASASITLRYIPDAPWLTSGGELALAQPLRPPSLWKKAPLVAAAAAVVAWLVLARLPARPRPKRRSVPARRQAPTGSIAVVRAEALDHGWTGRVTDGHDHQPIVGARIRIERRDFEHIHRVAETATDETGKFALPPIETLAGDQLVAEAPHHAKITRPLPGSGTLSVVLVLRKRALLDRLVAWARRQGPPFAAPPEPTPGHVRRTAAGDAAVARWASAVEEAAYGQKAIDEHAEAEVDRLAPPGAGAG